MSRRKWLVGIVLLVAGLLWVFTWQQNIHAQNSISEVTIQHTGCLGPCPVYEVTLMRDGTATFIGTRYVDKIGTYKAEFGGFDHLARAIEQRNFRHFSSHYMLPFTDFPSTITTVVQSGRRKTVDNYGNNGPQELWEIETLIDGIADEAQWQKVNNNTKYP